jgi:polar amino acid transport system substrate-binding protein
MVGKWMAVCMLMAGLCGCARKAADGKELRVGMDLGYPPFEMLDAAGNPDGVSVRMAEQLAKHVGQPLKIVPMDFSGLIPALQTGHIDVILSSMTANEERAKSIDFSEPYAFTGLAMLVAKDSSLRGVDDLKRDGTVVAVKAATTGEMWATKNLPGAKRVVFEDAAACVMEVAAGRAQAFLYDQLSIFRHAKENPETTRALLQPFVEEQWAIGVAKGNRPMRDTVNGFLTEFRTRNGFSELGERYLGAEKKFLEEQGVPFLLR